MKRLVAALVALVCGVSLPLAAQAAVPYAQIEGTGSTWSELIVQQWIADVNANGMKVVYTGGGSTKGRKDFANNSVDFAISEIPYQGTDEQGQADTSQGRDYAYLPIVAGGTAFTYQLKIGKQQVKNLRLSGETLAKIFTNQITNWDDPAIAKDNNGRKFPSLPIIPVVRSDGSGTTAQFTTWMDKQHPSIWRPYFGRSGLTSYYPKKSGSRMVSQAGSDQVMNTIKGFSGNGMIGYVEYSYAINANYPVVKVKNAAGYFVEPTQYNTAVALTQAKINMDTTSQLYLTQNLDGVYTYNDPRSYPISSYSYMLLPTGGGDQRMSTAKRQTLADFMYYSLCTGQTKAGAYGYSSLPLNLVQAGFEQIAKLKAADPAVELTNRDVKSCNNPTFDGKNPTKNLLAQRAPKPPECDKEGAGPCGTETGTGEPATDDAAPPPADAPPAGEAPPAAVDPATGQDVPVAESGTVPVSGGTQDVYASPDTLSADRAGDRRPFGWLIVVELLALVLLPGLLATALRRRLTSRGAAR
ncbi:phosphate ABC transporter substrate-binding protein PstS [Nocardioides sp. LHD-245]|uniref:phosphate ABC transporter substrate-binding protein PstS n=1 Tax=Nocardioides sp. LHD-245 TaxID=3051387 RepID=UPI0027DEFC12|nr:phosphate ABC transporter substrate-binding protein PstS [Nocardioides sp. LHD-245]